MKPRKEENKCLTIPANHKHSKKRKKAHTQLTINWLTLTRSKEDSHEFLEDRENFYRGGTSFSPKSCEPNSNRNKLNPN